MRGERRRALGGGDGGLLLLGLDVLGELLGGSVDGSDDLLLSGLSNRSNVLRLLDSRSSGSLLDGSSSLGGRGRSLGDDGGGLSGGGGRLLGRNGGDGGNDVLLLLLLLGRAEEGADLGRETARELGQVALGLVLRLGRLVNFDLILLRLLSRTNRLNRLLRLRKLLNLLLSRLINSLANRLDNLRDGSGSSGAGFGGGDHLGGGGGPRSLGGDGGLNGSGGGGGSLDDGLGLLLRRGLDLLLLLVAKERLDLVKDTRALRPVVLLLLLLVLLVGRLGGSGSDGSSSGLLGGDDGGDGLLDGRDVLLGSLLDLGRLGNDLLPRRRRRVALGVEELVLEVAERRTLLVRGRGRDGSVLLRGGRVGRGGCFRRGGGFAGLLDGRGDLLDGLGLVCGGNGGGERGDFGRHGARGCVSGCAGVQGALPGCEQRVSE
ncbi:hypothetical protein AAT19DRAFT_8938 [Rhodotorula toruloides]|uniref:Uncharacterized protein n=1 Tax=Rhodotorula toruloides TaxID=5286 RepID=A0A2T0AIT8_RHOTO|nr:hypothetical protein AAT19DRAFT_8938 [Rhodotorula toruloides]